MGLPEVAHSLAATVAALLATRDAALCLLQSPLRMAVVAWVRYDFPIGGVEGDPPPPPDAGLPSRGQPRPGGATPPGGTHKTPPPSPHQRYHPRLSPPP